MNWNCRTLIYNLVSVGLPPHSVPGSRLGASPTGEGGKELPYLSNHQHAPCILFQRHLLRSILSPLLLSSSISLQILHLLPLLLDNSNTLTLQISPLAKDPLFPCVKSLPNALSLHSSPSAPPAALLVTLFFLLPLFLLLSFFFLFPFPFSSPLFPLFPKTSLDSFFLTILFFFFYNIFFSSSHPFFQFSPFFFLSFPTNYVTKPALLASVFSPARSSSQLFSSSAPTSGPLAILNHDLLVLHHVFLSFCLSLTSSSPNPH
ncbi:hypothetical protein DSO57_1020803 [Entomophthora muscae]|uniref:Uncharacterized protein n=1 Tax=Entomophthora muscae TaxID=34485 RepID=A0ACC2T3G8_9FUNG|nr:hypothetical protein DSO57_1020803 [Entomophthora muscae]